MVKREKANYLIQSVSHAIDVLEQLASSSGEVGVTELSKNLKLHKNNVFRLLATLELRGYVEQNRDSEDYRLGVKALHLGQAYLAQSSLVAKAMPILRKLSEEVGETVNLAVLQNGYIQFPVSIESKRPVKVTARKAVSFLAKQCSVGRLLTAQLPDEVLAEVLAGNTPQEAAIRNQLNDLRSSGRAIDRGAIETDVISISKIVRDDMNEVVGAVEVLIPQYRAKIDDTLPLVEKAAEELTIALGASTTKTTVRAGIEKSVTSQNSKQQISAIHTTKSSSKSASIMK